MRSRVEDFELVRPRDLGDALARLAAEPGLRPLAGGTDVMVLLAAGKLPWKRLLDLWGLAELRGIEVAPGSVTLGALTTFSEVQEHALLRDELPLLGRAGAETGGPAIQNRGTIGGNIANASPAADTPPALLAYDAELELASVAGRRWVRYRSFHTGYKTTVMQPGELITRVRLARAAGRVHFYRKVGPRRAQAISKVCFAGVATLAAGRLGDVGIALGGVAPVVLPCARTEAALRGLSLAELAGALAGATATLSAEIAPIDDVRSTARYRRRVAENLLGAFVAEISARGT